MTVLIENKKGEERLYVPDIKRDVLISKVNKILKKYNPKDKIPVNIERIIEFDLGISVIPIPNLQKESGIRSYTDPKLKIIYIDDFEFNDIASCRVTLAHELGHILLHKDIFTERHFAAPEEYINFQNKINGTGYQILEAQARTFASYLLMPQSELTLFVNKKIETYGGIESMIPDHFQLLVQDIKNKFQVSKGCIQQQIRDEFPEVYKAIFRSI